MAYELGVAYYIKNMATGKYLNIYGNEQVSDGRTVNTHTFESGANAQRWIVRLCGEGGKIFSALSPNNYALNINQYENNRCTIWPASGNNNNADAVLDVLTVDRTNNIYRIKMLGNHNKFLTDMNTPDYSYALSNKVHWTDSANGDYSLWKFCSGQCPGDSSAPSAPTLTVGQTPSDLNITSAHYEGSNPFIIYSNGLNLRGQCTWYAWGRVSEKFDGLKYPVFSRTYNRDANDWLDITLNYTLVSIPSAGDVIVWNHGENGHVAVVEKVYGDRMYFTECNGYGSGNNAWNAGVDGVIIDDTIENVKSRYSNFSGFMRIGELTNV